MWLFGRGAIRLGRIFGIPIEVNYSWFLVFLLVTVSLASEYGRLYPHWPDAQRWGLGLVTSLLFFASVLAHELSHSIVAVRVGIPVHRITLFVFGGVSQISREASRPSIEAAIALVGPLCSLAIAGAAYGISIVLQPLSEQLFAIVIVLVPINIVLGIFNLVPGFPLDGGRVLRAMVWAISGSYRKATVVAARTGQIIAFAMIVGGIAWALWDRASFISGVWLAFIGWFLAQAASSSLYQLHFREGLSGYRAQDVMVRDFPTVDEGLTLDRLVEGHLLATANRCFVVMGMAGFRGLVTVGDVKNVPRTQWPITAVGQVMTPMERLKTVRPDAEAIAVLELMESGGISHVPVVENGRFLGLVTREQLVRLARLRKELRR